MALSTIVRCRAIIMDDGKLFVVKHRGSSGFYALPGGHLEPGEGIEECMRRELLEELGIEAELGGLLYVYVFTDKDIRSVEFFFEIRNPGDYAGLKELKGTHSSEISDFKWAGKDSDISILPAFIGDALKAGTVGSGCPKFVKG